MGCFYKPAALSVLLFAFAIIWLPTQAVAQVGGGCSPNGAEGIYNLTDTIEVVLNCSSGLWVAAAEQIGGTSASCSSTTAGTLQWTGSLLQYCNGSSWTNIGTSSGAGITLGTSASATNPQRSGDATTGFFSPAVSTVATSIGGTEMTRVTATGLGIGTTSPAQKLDVNGNINLPFTNKIIWNNDTNHTITSAAFVGTTIADSNAIYLSSNPVQINSGAANVGVNFIGGTSAHPLVASIASGNSLSDTTLTVKGVASQTGNLQEWQNSSGTLDVITSIGALGIGNTSPSYLLHVGSSSASGIVAELQNSSGACTYSPGSSSVTVSCSSDARFKEDIVANQNALAWLSEIEVRDFTWKPTRERRTGVVAQELIKTHPEMVHTDKDGYYTVDEPNPWKLIKAIQEQQGEIEQLRGELAALKHSARN